MTLRSALQQAISSSRFPWDSSAGARNLEIAAAQRCKLVLFRFRKMQILPSDRKSPRPVSRRGLTFCDVEAMQVICPTRQDFFESLWSVDLPAIVIDADTDAYARRPEADAGTRTLVPITVVTALDISLARRVTVGIPDDHTAAAAGPITASVLVADHANRLRQRQIRIRILAGGVDVGGIRAASKQRAGARQERDRECPHVFTPRSSTFCPSR